MDAIDIKAFAIIFDEWLPRAPQPWVHFDHFCQKWSAAFERLHGKCPFAFVSGVIFLCGVAMYITHSQSLTPDMALLFFIFSSGACVLAALSLFTEKGGLHKLQSIVGLFGNTNLAILFFNLIFQAD